MGTKRYWAIKILMNTERVEGMSLYSRCSLCMCEGCFVCLGFLFVCFVCYFSFLLLDIHPLSIPLILNRVAGVLESIPAGIGASGGVHPEQVASQSQGDI